MSHFILLAVLSLCSRMWSRAWPIVFHGLASVPVAASLPLVETKNCVGLHLASAAPAAAACAPRTDTAATAARAPAVRHRVVRFIQLSCRGNGRAPVGAQVERAEWGALRPGGPCRCGRLGSGR